MIFGALAVHEANCNASEGAGQVQEGTSSSTGKGWIDEVGDQFQQFLKDKVYGQENVKETSTKSDFLSQLGSRNRNDEESAIHGDKSSTDQNPLLQLLGPMAPLMENILNFGKSNNPSTSEQPSGQKTELVFSLLESVQHVNHDHFSMNLPDLLKTLKDAITNSLDQLKAAFGNIMEDVDPSIAISLMFFLATEDGRKNPSWKRQQHRFYEDVSKETIVDMHDALYLSQLAYMNSLDGIREQLKQFQDDEWELAYGTTDSLPHMPAHFLMLHKNLAPLPRDAIQSILPWENRDSSDLTAVLVVRGTKDISDALADTMLTPVEYRDGYAHGGILQNGKNLAERYLPKLKALLDHSGRQKMKLFLVGHSLGAAAAAIAAMELHDQDWIKVESIGFGCPSLLSAELSEGAKGYITTIVSDSDMVPRMSGSSVANLLLDLLEFDWTAMALEDLEFTMDRFAASFPFSQLLPNKDFVLDLVKGFIEREIRPKLNKPKRNRVPNVLIPPGSCIHFYRDGVGYSAVHTPCSFFSSIDLTRTLVDDHMVVPGYHRALVSIMRDRENDFNVSSSRFVAPAPVSV